ncbi:Uncharacterised protein [Campylobacter gracilis]|nr:Uncharacterised protein [Campylobacter gracilis]
MAKKLTQAGFNPLDRGNSNQIIAMMIDPEKFNVKVSIP